MTAARIPVAVAGAGGRMGRALIEAVLAAPDLQLVGALERAGHADLGADAGAFVGHATGVALTDDPRRAFERAGVVVDFSAKDATPGVLRAAADAGAAGVVGTTGLGPDGHAALAAAAARVPLVAAPNMSVGVHVLGHLLREAIARLGPDYDVEVVEAHHRRKVDAPSGTALRLAEIAAAALGVELGEAQRHGRSGLGGPRPDREIGVHAVRGGDVVGDHTVMLAGAGERLELVHRAHSRAVFTAGALRAARWVVGRAPGRYDMADVLGLAPPPAGR